MQQRILSIAATAAILLFGASCGQQAAENSSFSSASAQAEPAAFSSSSTPLPLSSAQLEVVPSQSRPALDTDEIGSDTVVRYSSEHGLYGLADKETLEILLPAEYDRIDPFSEGLSVAKRGNRFYYLDEQGKVAITLEESVTEAGAFEEGLACIWGNPPEELRKTVPFSITVGGPRYFTCIDKTGKSVLPYCIDGGWPFTEDEQLAEKYKSTIWSDRGTLLTRVIEQDSEFCVLNRKGEYIKKKIGQSFYSFRDGLLLMMKDEKWGYINEYGEVVIDFLYDEAYPFYDGLACVRIKDKYGFIDRSGKVVIAAQYEYASSFQDGFAVVYPTYFETIALSYVEDQLLAGDMGYITSSPEHELEYVFGFLSDAESSNFSCFYNYQIIDVTGKIVYRQDQLLRNFRPWGLWEAGTLQAHDLSGLTPQTYSFDKQLVVSAHLIPKNAAVNESGRWEFTRLLPPVQAIDVENAPRVSIPLEELIAGS